MAQNHPYTRMATKTRTGRAPRGAPSIRSTSKRPVYVLEAKSKDPYYNYGLQYIWVTADTWGPAYKMVHDRSDKYWKFMSVTTAGFETGDGNVKFLAWLDHMVVDSRRDHATTISQLHKDTVLIVSTPWWTLMTSPWRAFRSTASNQE